MTKAQRYDTVILKENIGAFQQGEKGAVVEVYTSPFEAYDIEIITDEGVTKGLLEGIVPQQIDLLAAQTSAKIRFKAIEVEDDGDLASVLFSDGTQVKVHAEELYARKSG